VRAVAFTAHAARPLWLIGTQRYFSTHTDKNKNKNKNDATAAASAGVPDEDASELKGLAPYKLPASQTQRKQQSQQLQQSQQSQQPVDGSLLAPVAIPGSALVTLADGGEVRVWKPEFDPPPAGSKYAPAEVLSVFGLRLTLVGLLQVFTPIWFFVVLLYRNHLIHRTYIMFHYITLYHIIGTYHHIASYDNTWRPSLNTTCPLNQIRLEPLLQHFA
jgi:hypothetical protein